MPTNPPIIVCLVMSDLGLGDGAYVREANQALVELAKAGLVDFSVAGVLPPELTMDLGYEDLGLPLAGSKLPGMMTQAAAEALLDSGIDCELLLLSTPLLLQPALDRIANKKVVAEAVLVLDNEGYQAPVGTPPVPVYVVRYSIKDGAFLCGVAAAQSSVTSFFTAIAYSGDPQAEEFLAAVEAGAKYYKSSSFVAKITVPADGETGLVTPENFRTALSRVKSQLGSAFRSNHFIVSLGRATPTILRALSGAPENAYVLGGYSDYRNIRPAKIVGCIEKHPGVALEIILRKAGSVSGIAGMATSGFIELGMAEGAVGFTSFEMYSRYNPDGEDIEDTVEGVKALIEAGELDADY